MNDTIKGLGEKALQTWGSLALVALFGVLGGYAMFSYLLHKDNMEHKRFEARQSREAKLVSILDKTCGSLQNRALVGLDRNWALLTSMEKNSEIWVPIIKDLGDHVLELRREKGKAQ